MSDFAPLRTILIHEYVTGGGLAGRPLPASWAAEGGAMRRALADDFASLDGVRVVMTLDDRLPEEHGPWTTVRVGPGEEERTFARLAAEADHTLCVAPETGGVLLERAEIIERVGGRSLGASPEAIGLTGDKGRMYLHWLGEQVPTPLTMPVRVGDPLPDPLRFRVPNADLLRSGEPRRHADPIVSEWDWSEVTASYPAVIKPVDGAGSMHTYLMESAGAVWPEDWAPRSIPARGPHPNPLPEGEGTGIDSLSLGERAGVRALSILVNGPHPNPLPEGEGTGIDSLSPWERAGVRALSILVNGPHPNPLPEGEGTGIDSLSLGERAGVRALSILVNGPHPNPLPGGEGTGIDSLSPWERAGVRALSILVNGPHPNPLPEGEGTGFDRKHGDRQTRVERPDNLDALDVALIQPYHAGLPLSASVLVGDGGRMVLVGIGRQRMEVRDGRFVYRGGKVPADPGVSVAEVLRAVETVQGLRGWVGLDFLWDEANGRATVLEINPRVTTSYVGWRAVLPAGMLAKVWLDVLDGCFEDGKESLTEWMNGVGPATFDADGSVVGGRFSI